MAVFKGALIGCGFFAVNQMHGWKDLADVEIVAICDRDPERLKIVGDQFGVATVSLQGSNRDTECTIRFVNLANGMHSCIGLRPTRTIDQPG